MNSIKIFKTIEIALEVMLLLVSAIAFFSPIVVTKDFVAWIFIAYLLLIANNLYYNRRLNLFQVWNASYVYVIISEMILISHRDVLTLDYQFAIAFLLLSNSVFICGYVIAKFSNITWNEGAFYRLVNKKSFIIVIILFIYLYFYYKYQNALFNFENGRAVSNALGSGSVMRIVVNSVGMLLPPLIGYYSAYHTKHKWMSLLVVIPIFIIQLLISTRFRVLYMALPYMIIVGILPLKINSLKRVLTLILLFIILSFGSSFLKKYRYTSLAEDVDFSALYSGSTDSFVSIADKMSPEGVVHMTMLANDYFAVHPLSHGKESLYITYFWVPRSIWNDKPTPIDYWLIREYDTIGESVTTASGFPGEIRADFGYYCFIIIFLWGICLKYLDSIVLSFNFKRESFNVILMAMLFPWIFFFVRSPNTATISFVLEVLLFVVLRKLFTKKV